MDLKHLNYFVAVAEAGSFTQAARKLHVTQPSLSKMVRLLEEDLGAQLIDRSSKQIELTDAAYRFSVQRNRLYNPLRICRVNLRK